MKKKDTAKMMGYMGVGVGLVLFAVLGLLPGSLLGGIVGLNIAGAIFGFPVQSAIIPRIIVGLSMIVGVLVSATIFIAGSTSAGWLIGIVIDYLNVDHPVEAHVKH
jgi:hypothetical protein